MNSVDFKLEIAEESGMGYVYICTKNNQTENKLMNLLHS